MKRTITLFVITLFLFSCTQNQTKQQNSDETPEPKGIENLAYKWGQMALTGTANDTARFRPRPTITSRYLGLIFVSIFDAWSRYDIQADNVAGLELGRHVAREVWKFYQQHIGEE
jgi:hypothetical protein